MLSMLILPLSCRHVAMMDILAPHGHARYAADVAFMLIAIITAAVAASYSATYRCYLRLLRYTCFATPFRTLPC